MGLRDEQVRTHRKPYLSGGDGDGGGGMSTPIVGESAFDSHGDLVGFGRRDDSVEFGVGCAADSCRCFADSRWNLGILE